MSKQLLNVSETAAALGIGRRTLYDWIEAGKFPVAPAVQRPAPKWRKVDIDAFLAGIAG